MYIDNDYDSDEESSPGENLPSLHEEDATQSFAGILCPVCARPATFQCSRCKGVQYCDREHQKSHWDHHKHACYLATIRVPPMPSKFLIVAGAIFDINDDFWLRYQEHPSGKILPNAPFTNGFKPILEEQGIAYKVVDITKKDSIMKELSKNEYNVCIILNVQTGGEDKQVTENPNLQEYLQQWMREGGGKLFVHGGTSMISSWMPDKGWKFKDYRRTQHALASNALWSSVEAGPPAQLDSLYSAKSALIGGVAIEDQVYSATGAWKFHDDMVGLTTMAYTRFGNGRLGFIGDVNGESPTIRAVIALAGI
jgi:hypothetical protein